MMTPQNDVHFKVVQDWEEKAAKGLTPDQQVRLLEKAIGVVEKRACLTLSSITLMVILDRVLHQSKEQFPLLSMVYFDSHFLSFLELDNNQNHKVDDLAEALRFLLVELLRVLSRITADILTIPLHNELLKVTWNESEKT